MYAITGITGQVGRQVADRLIDAGRRVRAVVRDAAKGETWSAKGCEVALANAENPKALRTAFADAEGVFILLPPHFDPSPDFRESNAMIAAFRDALAAARPGRVVCLSTIGAQASQPNLLNQLGLLEKALGTLPMPVAFLRAGWFIENSAWDIAPARADGEIPTFLQPSDKAVPMVATADVASVAAELLQERWQGTRVVELEGPRRVAPDDIAACLGKLLGREVRARPVPRDTWEGRFRSQGMHNPLPRMQMLDGFNAGWIAFEGSPRKGEVPLESVLKGLIASQA